jgi:hypothetical protein
MSQETVRGSSWASWWANWWASAGMLVALGACWQAQSQTATAPYPKMAPLEQYLMPRDAEIALARSAAPDSLSHDADVLVLGSHGYETAVKGRNGFVCVVQRSWTTNAGDPNFWNPKLKGPACFNAPAARSFLPIVFKKTEFILGGQSEKQMFESLKASFAKQQLGAMEPGSMCYMMSRDQYLGDAGKHWHPHLMFFLPETPALAWGAGLPGSPVIEGQDPEDHLTIFMVPVGKWSDGTAERDH